MRHLLLVLLFTLGANLPSANAALADWHTSMVHAAWTKRDGAPTGAYDFAQDARGMLWFATTEGLYTFDGVRFEHLTSVDGNPLRSANTNVIRVFGTAIWVGYNFGGVSVFDQGKVTHYGQQEGLPERSVYQLERTPKGTPWTSTTVGLYWLDGQRWHHVEPEDGLPAGDFHYFSVLRDGSILAYHNNGMYRSAPDGHQFQRVAGAVDIQIGHEWPDGDIMLVSHAEHKLYRYAIQSGRITPFSLPEDAHPFGIFLDKRAALWINTDAGVKLLGPDLRTKRTFYAPQDLSGKIIYSVFTDREGNLWFCTENGVDRIRESRLTNITLPARMFSGLSVQPDGLGTVWVGNYQITGNYQLASFGLMPDGSRVATPLRNVTATTRGPDGSAWFGSAEQVWHRTANGWRSWPLPPDLKGHDAQSMAVDTSGQLWISVLRKGVFVFREGQWQPGGGYSALAGRTAVFLHADPQGNVWIGYPGNRLALVMNGKVREFGPEHGISVGNVTAMAGQWRQLWIAGDQGTQFFDGERFITMHDASGQALTAMAGMVFTRAGELWLHGAGGVYRISAEALKSALQKNSARLDVELFNYLDGHEGKPAQLRPLSGLAEAPDGKIWYATAAAVGWIDPAHIARNTIVPHPQVLRLRTDDKEYRVGPNLVLPQQTRNLELEFTEASLSVPERVRFRFRLAGLEEHWRDAGTRRAAYYTNLSPGAYRFEVMAANEDGVWSQIPGELSFHIEPAFYQTGWFRTLAGLLVAALICAIYWWRLALATARLADRLRERMLERQRIARTLHDNFLQSVQALIMQFSFIKESLPHDHPAQQRIDVALDAADGVMIEGRDQVLDLRVQHGLPGQLEAALRDVGHRLAERQQADFALAVEGTSKPLTPSVSSEAFAIAREAIVNAFHHAQGNLVQVQLRYGRRHFELSVRDNGCGISEEVMGQGHRPGHWGLTGMRERAQDIGAACRVDSVVGKGTTVTLRIASRRAYVGSSLGSRGKS